MKYVYIALGVLVVAFYWFTRPSEKSMVIVVPSYNNLRYFKGNLESIFSQRYKNYRIIYVDDASKDGMSNLLDAYLAEKKIDFISGTFEEVIENNSHFFTLIHNQKRLGALENLYRVIHKIADSDVVVLLDGDDKFSDPKVLKRVNDAYSGKKEVWLTHGTLIEESTRNHTWNFEVPKEVVKENRFRDFRCPSHLRTFYAWLFKKIEIEDLLYKGEFFPMAWDMAIMYPMIEMAGERYHYLRRINYLYNVENLINDNKVNPGLQNELDAFIRAQKRYEPL